MRERCAYSKWEMVRVCLHCLVVISKRDYYDSDGECVHCGNISRVLPDITNKSRRKKYHGLRKDAIEAQKVRNSNIFARPFLYFKERVRRRQTRPFVWEYKE